MMLLNLLTLPLIQFSQISIKTFLQEKSIFKIVMKMIKFKLNRSTRFFNFHF